MICNRVKIEEILYNPVIYLFLENSDINLKFKSLKIRVLEFESLFSEWLGCIRIERIMQPIAIGLSIHNDCGDTWFKNLHKSEATIAWETVLQSIEKKNYMYMWPTFFPRLSHVLHEMYDSTSAFSAERESFFLPIAREWCQLYSHGTSLIDNIRAR